MAVSAFVVPQNNVTEGQKGRTLLYMFLLYKLVFVRG